eukprot:TRINITY_DN29618_c0_g1_i1.p1 TRINITY_DN29618_c0_g1~~TRINITY_DN29618_c0_g1_i1.p1  ORF type:complete len:218 (+),score=24.88 TRINITY_DN29618_c0_g1_i1:84-737(+)
MASCGGVDAAAVLAHPPQQRGAGAVVVPLLRAAGEEQGERMLRLDEVLQQGHPWLARQVREPRCFIRYELSLAGPSSVCVSFHAAGAISAVGACVVRLGGALESAEWEHSAIGSRWPLAKSPLILTGVDPLDLSEARPLLRLRRAHPPQHPGTPARRQEGRDVYLAFGSTHRGLVIELRPVAVGLPTLTCHRLGDWPAEPASPRPAAGRGAPQRAAR